jgi:hypothetical protein
MKNIYLLFFLSLFYSQEILNYSIQSEVRIEVEENCDFGCTKFDEALQDLTIIACNGFLNCTTIFEFDEMDEIAFGPLTTIDLSL